LRVATDGRYEGFYLYNNWVELAEVKP